MIDLVDNDDAMSQILIQFKVTLQGYGQVQDVLEDETPEARNITIVLTGSTLRSQESADYVPF